MANEQSQLFQCGLWEITKNFSDIFSLAIYKHHSYYCLLLTDFFHLPTAIKKMSLILNYRKASESLIQKTITDHKSSVKLWEVLKVKFLQLKRATFLFRLCNGMKWSLWISKIAPATSQYHCKMVGFLCRRPSQAQCYLPVTRSRAALKYRL